MNELISIQKNDDGTLAVSARDLHEKLQASERFNSWFERMLKYGFEENIDYTSVKVLTEVQNNGGTQTRELQEYYISIDMAKEICMLQRSEIGKKFRQYFINCEKTLKNVIEHKVIKPVELTDYEKKHLDIEDRKLRHDDAELLKAIADRYEGKSKTFKEVCYTQAVNMVSGKEILSLPVVTKKTYNATDTGKIVAARLNYDNPISGNMIGRCAEALKIKNEQYGENQRTVNHGRECDNFMYYENAVDFIADNYENWYSHRKDKAQA